MGNFFNLYLQHIFNILLQKFYKANTPSRRFLTNLYFIDSFNISKLVLVKRFLNKYKFKDIKKNKISKPTHVQKNKINFNLFGFFPKFLNYIIRNIVWDKILKKEYVLLINKYQTKVLYPSLSTSYIGSISNIKYMYLFKKLYKSPINSLITLEDIPYNFFLCYIKNFSNNKFTFVKSLGCNSQKLKTKKKNKLLLIILPSKKLFFLPKNTMCILGKLPNSFFKSSNLGKYSCWLKKKYTINVRGVAKNPVDHPNGGRSKSKNPQLSPWGWIAKHNN